MFCPISLKAPVEAVVTPQGSVYESRLLEEHRKVHGDVDPVSGEPFDPALVIRLKKGTTPGAGVEGASFSDLMRKLQSEYDVVLLQNFKLRRALDELKGQLSQSLYQHDAACRVVARLTRERDLYKERMGTAAPVASTGDDTASTASGLLPAAKIEEIAANANELQEHRKATSLTQYDTESLVKWTCAGTAVPHEAACPGINDVAVKEQPGQGTLAVTAGEDGHITLTELKTYSRVARFQGSEKAVTCVDVHPDSDVIVAGFKDKSIRFFTGEESGGTLSFSSHKVLRAHTESVKSIEIHPLGDFIMSAGGDERILFADIESGKYLGPAIKESHGIRTVRFHPDGNIFLTGCEDGTLGVFDIRDLSEKLRLNASEVPLTGIQSFENGYYLGCTDTSGYLKVFDLRKMDRNPAPLSEQLIIPDVSGGRFSLALHDRSTLIGVCGADASGRGVVRLGSLGKRGKEIHLGPLLDGTHNDIVTRCRFASTKEELITVSKDNTVALWTPQ